VPAPADFAEAVRAEAEARVAHVHVERIELGRVRDYLLALDEPAGIGEGDRVPALFLLTLARLRRPQAGVGGGGLKMGDAYEFTAPVFVGDVITSRGRLISIEPKTMRSGDCLVVTMEWAYENQRGEPVGVSRSTTLRRIPT
jgi:hypothetical protein